MPFCYIGLDVMCWRVLRVTGGRDCVDCTTIVHTTSGVRKCRCGVTSKIQRGELVKEERDGENERVR